MFLQNNGELFYASLCDGCHLCRHCRESVADNGEGHLSHMESRENRTESVMINGAVIKAFRSKQCEAEADMPFQQCFQIAVRLIDIIRNGDCNVNEKGIKELMALLRQIIWLSLPVFQSQDRAMNSSLEIMLGVFLIILGRRLLAGVYGGRRKYRSGKGNCRLRKEFWSRGSDCLVYETIDGADIWGIICIESPANTLMPSST